MLIKQARASPRPICIGEIEERGAVKNTRSSSSSRAEKNRLETEAASLSDSADTCGTSFTISRARCVCVYFFYDKSRRAPRDLFLFVGAEWSLILLPRARRPTPAPPAAWLRVCMCMYVRGPFRGLASFFSSADQWALCRDDPRASAAVPTRRGL